MQQATFKFKCPHCGQKLEAEWDWQGELSECPNCHKQFNIPKPPPAPRAKPKAAPPPGAAPEFSIFPCPHCGRKLKSPKGCGMIRCPTCQTIFTPAATEPPPGIDAKPKAATPPPAPRTKPKAATPPPLDEKRIAKDEALGIRFSDDKRTLVEYPAHRRFMEYAIPDGVTAVDAEAFKSSKLRRIVIPDGVTSIGAMAFAECKNLTAVTIPDSVTAIGALAFDDCESLREVTIPNGVTAIGEYTFSGCKNLKEVTIPDGVTSIGEGAFQECEGLTAMTIPDGVTAIGEWAFKECKCLSEVTIPDGVTAIGEGTFADCESLREVTIPNGVTAIGEYTFSGCKNLKEVTIPDGVTAIGEGAFQECEGLTAMTIPDGVTAIDTGTFAGCESLREVTIPDGVTSIDTGTFAGCKRLREVTIPDSVKTIGKGAFVGCESLRKVTIPNGVTVLGEGAFKGCKSLKEVTIPDSVKTIGKGAFDSGVRLERIHEYTCPYCGRKRIVAESFAGLHVRCECGQSFPTASEPDRQDRSQTSSAGCAAPVAIGCAVVGGILIWIWSGSFIYGAGGGSILFFLAKFIAWMMTDNDSSDDVTLSEDELPDFEFSDEAKCGEEWMRKNVCRGDPVTFFLKRHSNAKEGVMLYPFEVTKIKKSPYRSEINAFIEEFVEYLSLIDEVKKQKREGRR